ncbi:flavin reductase like domain-containing protein [Amanita rubescens]|nr:flavin reductase like domain-containing protein [Amanita rubescens]
MSKTAKTVARLFQQKQRTPFRHCNHSTIAHGHVTRELRALLRNSAQPVAVVTSILPQKSKDPVYHGATLSSFTSISMDPYPLVAFSLRIPSRMATSLNSVHPEQPSHMVINLLAAGQGPVAVAFSRPDIHAHPFTTVPYTLTKDGLPVIKGSLGAMSCKLVSSALPLHDLGYLKGEGTLGNEAPELTQGNIIASELFIAQVMWVENVGVGHSDVPRLPLLYYHREYTTVSPIPERTST